MTNKVEVGQVWQYGYDGSEYKILRRHESGSGWRIGEGPGDHFSDLAFGASGRYGLTLVSPPQYPARAACHPDCGKTGKEHVGSKHPSMKPGYAWDIDDRIYCSTSCLKAKGPLAPQEAAVGGGDAPCPGQCGGAAAPDGSNCARCFASRQVATAKAPVCTWRIFGPLHSADVLLRHTVDGVAAICGSCWDAHERANCQMPVDAEDALLHILHNDDIPERLPRPQLAVDWVEDCLPDGGR